MYGNINVTSTADDFKRNFKKIYQMNKPENYTTPVCLLQYAWLVEPDTKFDQSGLWQVECLIEPEKAQELEEQLNGLLERWKAELKAANPNKTFKLAPARFGYEEVDGTPYFRVKTKMKGGGVRADGSQWKQRPPILYNSDGTPMSEEQRQAVNKLGPGTTGQVNIRCKGWETPAFGVGIKLEPEAVIIHNFVQYVKDAKGYGFETKEATEEEAPKVAGFETVPAGNEF